MVSMKDIRAVTRQIAREFHPQRVILFGSHARGTAGRDSDVDLLVIMPFRGRTMEKSVEIHLKVHPLFPADILVRTPQAVRDRLRMGDSFMQEILQEGKVLYEASPGRVDCQGGGRFRRHAARISGPLKTQLRRRMLSRPAMRREVP
jgi:predicted nucleotidyltransferase